MNGRPFRAVLLILVLVGGGAGIVIATRGHGTADSRRPGSLNPVSAVAPVPAEPGGAAAGRPNIIFVLTDDLSLNLLRFMPHVQEMMRAGLTFRDYFVSDSLCCPSRASIFSGNFPHNTHVFGNFGPNAGFQAFYDRGEERHTFAVALQRAGYQTAMMGKYLNGYMQAPGHAADGTTTTVPATYVPPGWSEWNVAGWGYPKFNYTLNQNGALRSFGARPADYLTDVLARTGVEFVNRAARSPAAVLPRARDVRAARTVGSRPPGRPRLSRAGRSPHSRLRCAAHPCSALARRASRLDSQTNKKESTVSFASGRSPCRPSTG